MKHRATFTLALLSTLALGCKQTSEQLPQTEAARLLAVYTSTQDPASDPAPALDHSLSASDPPAVSLAAAESRAPDVIYVPTPQPVVDKMLELARVKKDDLVYDLGCGDGRIVVTAAKRYGARAVGYDIDPERVAEARENVRESGVEHLVRIEQRDIFELDLRPANVVTLYLLPRLNEKLIPQLERMRPGSRIVSHDFDIKGVTPLKQLAMEVQGYGHSVYLFHIPLTKERG